MVQSSLEPKERRVCVFCVIEPFLSGEIEKYGTRATCFYCKKEENTFSVDQIADPVGFILTDFYRRTYNYDGASPPEGEPVRKVINDLTGTMDDTLAEDVRSILEQRFAAEWPESDDHPFDPEVRYARNNFANTWDFDSGWLEFEESLKRETRYFNKSAEFTLASIFEGIDSYRTMSERPVIVDAGPGSGLTMLYRAREFQSELELRAAIKRPDLEVGPPPPAKAVAGRMNASGITVFYGATDPTVALAEVRPPVGCKVLIGRFEVIRPLKLLDLAALNDLRDDNGSLFDNAYRHRLKRAHFLRGLSFRISKPVMPNDQPTEYVPTQAIADFLATAECPPLPLDGIIYPSVQGGYPGPFERSKRFALGRHRKESFNVVLFHKAARVQLLDEGADVSVSDSSWLSFPVTGYFDDGPEVQYTVWVTNAQHSAPEECAWDGAALKFSSLDVHYVKGAKFDTEGSSISRFSTEKREEDNDG